MSDLIEREAVLTLIQSNWYGSNAFYINHISELPAVDAVSVTRCKECKHIMINSEQESKDEDVTNYYMCDYWHRSTYEDGYCHAAKIRGEG